jgi:hypothetical protein
VDEARCGRSVFGVISKGRPRWSPRSSARSSPSPPVPRSKPCSWSSSATVDARAADTCGCRIFIRPGRGLDRRSSAVPDARPGVFTCTGQRRQEGPPPAPARDGRRATPRPDHRAAPAHPAAAAGSIPHPSPAIDRHETRFEPAQNSLGTPSDEPSHAPPAAPPFHNRCTITRELPGTRMWKREPRPTKTAPTRVNPLVRAIKADDSGCTPGTVRAAFARGSRRRLQSRPSPQRHPNRATDCRVTPCRTSAARRSS